MPDFDPMVVAPPVIPVHDREIVRELTFSADEDGNLEHVQVSYDEYKNDGTMTPARKSLSLYAGVQAFAASIFKPGAKATVNALVEDKTNESPPE